ncbi:hypothetical protein NFHSH190041_17040 [Shewanella sp. NFH-SH190041]|uniref:SMI1/KNR4 family protein n=1 Tax=Shewanella sp. NFH-SH190041 TaxID=2950245 RepID=UPI0021C2CC6B|nr:SMI1/KNR4 family protein [Shewanella sp. NFH-SH190041]BDM64252.1 hypothetical protein NFHSH190041_17040 [Shewanella sp. NFH-SH190041]
MITKRITHHQFAKLKNFVDAYLSSTDYMFAPIVPKDMAIGKPYDNGWSDWQAVDSPVTDDDIVHVEQILGCKLPPLFCGYLTYKSLLMTEFVVRLPQTPCNAPLKDFLSYANLRETLPNGIDLLPFGYDSNDAGCICFDISNENHYDYPIVLFDHTKFYKDNDYKGDLVWQNFEALLQQITNEFILDK